MSWERVRAADKAAFHEDLAQDRTLSKVKSAIIATIAKNWSLDTQYSACSLTYLANGATTSKKIVNRYMPSVLGDGRVFVVRKATHVDPTRYGVNWWFRGAIYVRDRNGGNPIVDCRSAAEGVPREGVPQMARGESPKRGTNTFSKEKNIAAPKEGARLEARPGAAGKTNEKSKTRKGPPGFALWKIVHAKFETTQKTRKRSLVVALKSFGGRNFKLHLPVHDEPFAGFLEAAGVELEPDASDKEALALVRRNVWMSTSREGDKEFLSVEYVEDMRVDRIRDLTIYGVDGPRYDVMYNDLPEDWPSRRTSSHMWAKSEAAQLAEAVGGDIVGARIRYTELAWSAGVRFELIGRVDPAELPPVPRLAVVRPNPEPASKPEPELEPEPEVHVDLDPEPERPDLSPAEIKDKVADIMSRIRRSNFFQASGGDIDEYEEDFA
jgi:hypothetical protein